jgi:hypothetical protein
MTQSFRNILILASWLVAGISGSIVLSQPEAPSVPPPFSIRQDETGWWLVSPDGKPFFSRGVCVITQGQARESFDPNKPGYVAWQHYDTPGVWADSTLKRLKSWGFTTVGGWSDYAALRQSKEQSLWLTPVLHVGSTAGIPWWDMWDPNIIARMEEIAREQILPLRDDPHLLGYYSDNEIGWWNGALWKITLEHAPSSGQRQRLIRLLRDAYQDDWGKLIQDFEPFKADNWKQLQDGGMLYLRGGSRGIQVMRKFLGLMAERYYQLMHDTIRKYDRRALILGDRYQSFYYPEVARAAAPWVDTVSTNLNANWTDGTYLRYYLDTLHQLTGKPILVGEFYMAATDNRSGNHNSKGLFPVVADQRERAPALRTTLALLAGTPYVVGADWFQYFDEPPLGRFDGEDYDFGLVDINDRPYEEVTEAFASTDVLSLKSHRVRTRPDASAGVPPAPDDPLGGFDPRSALKLWDRGRGFVKPASELPLADLYICWNPKAIYLGLYALDVTEDALYRDKTVPEADRSLWVIEMPGRKPLQIRLGSGRKPAVSDLAVRVENLSGTFLTVRNIAAVELTAEYLGRKRFSPGDRVELMTTFDTHCRSYRIAWKGSFSLKK